MTSKRDSKSKPKAGKQPQIEKQTLKDLKARDAEKVEGGGLRTAKGQHFPETNITP